MNLEKILSILNENKEVLNETKNESNENSLINKLEKIKNTTHKQLNIELDYKIEKHIDEVNRPLSLEEKKAIKEQTGWSDEVIESIKTKGEAEIYLKADLKEIKIGDRIILIKKNIDFSKVVDIQGRTNLERIQSGLSPIGEDNNPLELHHMGQKNDGPLVVLTKTEHRGTPNNSILHDTTKSSEINRQDFDKERSTIWKEIGKEILNKKENE